MWCWCGIGRARVIPARLLAAAVLAVVTALVLGIGLAATPADAEPYASPTTVDAGASSAALDDCACCNVVCPQSKAVGAGGSVEYAGSRPPIARPDNARQPAGWNARIDPPPPKPM